MRPAPQRSGLSIAIEKVLREREQILLLADQRFFAICRLTLRNFTVHHECARSTRSKSAHQTFSFHSTMSPSCPTDSWASTPVSLSMSAQRQREEETRTCVPRVPLAWRRRRAVGPSALYRLNRRKSVSDTDCS